MQWHTNLPVRRQRATIGGRVSVVRPSGYRFRIYHNSYVQRSMPWVNAVNADLAILDSKPGSGNFVCGNRPFSVCHQCLFSDLYLVGDQQKQLILHQNFQDSQCNAIILTFSTSEMFARKPLSRECLWLHNYGIFGHFMVKLFDFWYWACTDLAGAQLECYLAL